MTEQVKKILIARKSDLETKESELREKIKSSMDEDEIKELGEKLDSTMKAIEECKKALTEDDEPEADPENDPAPANDPDPAGERGKDPIVPTETRNNKTGLDVLGSYNLNNNNNENRGGNNMPNKQLEERAAAFATSGKMSITELRSVLVSSGNLATPTKVSGINDIAANGLPTILDRVKVVDMNGAGSNKVAYVDSESAAAQGTEGTAPTTSEPAFKFVEIKPFAVNTIAYVSNQVKKLSPLAYQEKVQELALKALRKKVANLITVGTGSNTVTGISASGLVTAKPITGSIGADTLREIVLSYGGDDEVGGAAVLELCKADLQLFGKVRGTQEKKAVYEITVDENNPNMGYIKDGGTIVRYALNSNLASGTMLYGQPLNYELDLFSNYEVLADESYKFAEGLITIRGEVLVGGAVVAKGGFVKVTVGAAG